MNLDVIGRIIISMLVLASWAAIGILLIFGKLPANELMKEWFAATSPLLGVIVNHWVGSSTGSKQKDQIIARQSDQLAASMPVNAVPFVAPVGKP